MIEVFTIAGKPHVRAVAAAGEASLTGNYLARLAKNRRLPGRKQKGRVSFLNAQASANFLRAAPTNTAAR
jgi:hypothetical protein